MNHVASCHWILLHVFPLYDTHFLLSSILILMYAGPFPDAWSVSTFSKMTSIGIGGSAASLQIDASPFSGITWYLFLILNIYSLF
jgi:hypothetical protein